MRYRPYVVAVALGLAYGLVTRIFFSLPDGKMRFQDLWTVMSLAYLFIAPVGLGALTIATTDRERSTGWSTWIFTPWITCLLLMGSFVALGWEGLICVAVGGPIYFALSSIGGIVMGLVLRGQRGRGNSSKPLAALLLAPLAIGPVEQGLGAPEALREVRTAVHIQAPPAAVWREVVEVRAIAPEERRPSFFTLIGIPRPLEATVDRQAVGGVREARFVEGVRFRETITRFEPERALGFTIAAEPSSLGAHVLDEHVRVGGTYFDVQYGEFDLEPQPDGSTILHLMSRHRLDTRFNTYAGLWTDAIMDDLQAGICNIIRRRSEAR
jgi:uncharacterized protein YndB with AHSA1/START domain